MSDEPHNAQPDDIRERMEGPTQGTGPGGSGEGFASDRPGNEYGAGGAGYAGGGAGYAGGAQGDAYGASGNAYGAGGPGYGAGGNAYGAGANWSSPGSGYGDYGAGRGPGASFRDAARGAAPRFLDDLARVVTDAAGAAQGVRREVETAMRAQAEGVLARMDVVRRDEFEAMSEVAARARAECDAVRAECDALRTRIEALEARFGEAKTE